MRVTTRRLLPINLLVMATVIAPGTASADTRDDWCADGVAVVVDFTDLGGDVEVGCAEGDPASGREALEGAGFASEESEPGLICAINSMPDPCPTEFDGNFWSYWTGDGDEWTAHQEGFDGTDPEPGDVEGWRYNDGSDGPAISLDALEAESEGDVGSADDSAAEDSAASAEGEMGLSVGWITAIVVVTLAVGVGAGALVMRRRGRA